MEHYRHDHFATDQPATNLPAPIFVAIIFVAIIGTPTGQRHIIAAFTRRQALDGMIAYLNYMMAEEVLLMGASEIDTIRAIQDNLYAEVEIVECDPWQGDCCGGSAIAFFG